MYGVYLYVWTLGERVSIISDEGVPIQESSHVRRIGENLLWSQVGRVLDIGLGLVFSIIVIRSLGPQQYAIYVVAWSVANVAALIASLGYSETLTRYLPEINVKGNGTASAFARQLLWDRVWLSLLVAAVVWLVSAPLADWTHTPGLDRLIGIVIGVIIVQGAWDIFVAYYAATLRMRDHAAIRIAGQLTGLGVMLALFGSKGTDVSFPLLAQLAGYLVSSLLYFFGARKTLGIPGKPVMLIKVRQFGLYVWLTNLATLGLTSQVDVLLITTLITDSTQVSFYNVAAVLLSRLLTVLTGWTAILMPTLADAHSRNGVDGLARGFNLFMKVNLAVLLPPLIFTIVWSGPLITAIFGEAFARSAALLAIFALFSLASVLAGANVCHPLLYVADRQSTLLWLRIGAGLLNILLDVLLIPAMGAAGAVVGTGLSNLLTHLIEFGLSRHLTGAIYPFAVAAKLFGASALAILPIFFFSTSGLISLVAGGLMFGVIFSVAIWFLRPLSDGDYAILGNALPRLRPVLRLLSAV
jgi:O-antigen/teichoic acid export membrane protein